MKNSLNHVPGSFANIEKKKITQNDDSNEKTISKVDIDAPKVNIHPIADVSHTTEPEGLPDVNVSKAPARISKRRPSIGGESIGSKTSNKSRSPPGSPRRLWTAASAGHSGTTYTFALLFSLLKNLMT